MMFVRMVMRGGGMGIVCVMVCGGVGRKFG